MCDLTSLECKEAFGIGFLIFVVSIAAGLWLGYAILHKAHTKCDEGSMSAGLFKFVGGLLFTLFLLGLIVSVTASLEDILTNPILAFISVGLSLGGTLYTTYLLDRSRRKPA